MTNITKSSIVGFVTFLLPALLFGETIVNSNPPKITCPDHIQDALLSLQANIDSKKWTNVVVDACPHIQSEIINNVDTILTSTDFDLHLALMNQMTMRFIRNAIFAKKGYKFEDNNLQKQFSSYPWYKSLDNNDAVVLSAEEKRRVGLLKTIEDKWILTRPGDVSDVVPQVLPSGVVIKKEKNNKILLKLKKKSLDISSRVVVGSSDTIKYTVHVNNDKNALLLCTQKEYGQVDGRIVQKMVLYSTSGNRLYEFMNIKENWIGGLQECPFWTKERPNVLISYNNAGCCGATWDILATFDAKLNPVAVLNCSESACGGTSFFSEVNEGNLYLSVAAPGRISKNKRESPFRLIEYDGDNSINNWAIWTIEKNGDLKLVVDIKESVHNVPVTPQSWNVIVDVPYPTENLMATSKNDVDWGPDAEVLTSYKSRNYLVLYRATRSDFAKYHYSTTVVPLP